MEELVKEIRALREDVAGLRQDIRNQAQAAARALTPLSMAVSHGEMLSPYVPEPPLGSRLELKGRAASEICVGESVTVKPPENDQPQP